MKMYHIKVFEFNKDGNITAHFLDVNWKEPKEEVQNFWRRIQQYGGVAAHVKVIFSEASKCQAISNDKNEEEKADEAREI